MTQEEKDLLLKDLCMRLPHGVKVESVFINPDTKEHKSCGIEVFDATSLLMIRDGLGEFKPYLYPLSSMTEEQQEELITITNGKFRYNMLGDINNNIPRKDTSEWGISENAYINSIKVINILYIWLLKNHFNINGLIPMGLAKDSTGLNIYQSCDLMKVKTPPSNNPQITIGTKIRSKANPNKILNIISNDCHGDEFECTNGSVLSLKQIEKYYDIIGE